VPKGCKIISIFCGITHTSVFLQEKMAVSGEVASVSARH